MDVRVRASAVARQTALAVLSLAVLAALSQVLVTCGGDSTTDMGVGELIWNEGNWNEQNWQ